MTMARARRMRRLAEGLPVLLCPAWVLTLEVARRGAVGQEALDVLPGLAQGGSGLLVAARH